MIHWLIQNAGMISGSLGMLGSIVLASPLVSELGDRKLWDALNKFKRKVASDGYDTEPLDSIRGRLLDARLGRYERARWVTFSGLALLGAAFFFLMIDAANRQPAP